MANTSRARDTKPQAEQPQATQGSDDLGLSAQEQADLARLAGNGSATAADVPQDDRTAQMAAEKTSTLVQSSTVQSNAVHDPANPKPGVPNPLAERLAARLAGEADIALTNPMPESRLPGLSASPNRPARGAGPERTKEQEGREAASEAALARADRENAEAARAEAAAAAVPGAIPVNYGPLSNSISVAMKEAEELAAQNKRRREQEEARKPVARAVTAGELNESAPPPAEPATDEASDGEDAPRRRYSRTGYDDLRGLNGEDVDAEMPYGKAMRPPGPQDELSRTEAAIDKLERLADKVTRPYRKFGPLEGYPSEQEQQGYDGMDLENSDAPPESIVAAIAENKRRREASDASRQKQAFKEELLIRALTTDLLLKTPGYLAFLLSMDSAGARRERAHKEAEDLTARFVRVLAAAGLTMRVEGTVSPDVVADIAQARDLPLFLPKSDTKTDAPA